MCKYWFKTQGGTPLFGCMTRPPTAVAAWCGMKRGPRLTRSMQEERPGHMPVAQRVGLRNYGSLSKQLGIAEALVVSVP